MRYQATLRADQKRLQGPGHSVTGCASLAAAQFSTGLARHFPGVLSLTTLWGSQAEKHICLGRLLTPNPVCMGSPSWSQVCRKDRASYSRATLLTFSASSSPFPKSRMVHPCFPVPRQVPPILPIPRFLDTLEPRTVPLALPGPLLEILEGQRVSFLKGHHSCDPLAPRHIRNSNHSHI